MTILRHKLNGQYRVSRNTHTLRGDNMKLKSILIASLLAASSLAAQAENLSTNAALTGIPNLSGGFSLTHLWSGMFTDTITFTPPSASGLVDGAIMTIGFGTANIDFYGADINGNALTLVAAPPAGPGAGYFEAGYLLPTNINGPLVLTVHGYAGPTPQLTDRVPISATYTGSINVRPVPEPETYAMLLGGLGVLAFLGRRRKT